MSERIEIDPTTTRLFWNRKLEEEWTPKLARIRKVYSEAEIKTVAKGMRRVYVLHVNSRAFDKSYDFLRENDMVFYPTNKSGVYQGFSHKHMPVKHGEAYTLYGGAVKNDDREAGELFVEYTKATPTNHVEIGRLLGYPECCLEFFDKNWNKSSIDPMYEASLRTKGAKRSGAEATVNTHPYCNNMLRYFGIRMTPHLTCSLQCEDTIKWGEQWFETMLEIDEEAAEWTKELLSMPLTWNCYRGVAIIDTPVFRGVTNSDQAPTKKTVINEGWNQ